MPVVTFDFTGSPPSQTGSGADRIPPGRYAVQIAEVIDGESKKGKRMLTVWYAVTQGPATGKKLVERFMLDQQGSVGYKRLHAMFMALGAQVGERVIQLDVDKLVGRQCIAQVSDETQEASGDYAERIVSRIDLYYTMQGIRPDKDQSAAAPAPTTTAAAPVAVAAPIAAPMPAPAPVAQPGPVDAFAPPVQMAPPPAQAPAAAPVSVAAEIDQLFA